MTRGKALAAGLLFPVLAAAVIFMLFFGRGGGDGRVVRIELQDAPLLAPGDDVRVHGTTVGSVDDMSLTDHGTVMVRLRLDQDGPTVRADATASVQATDLLGDVAIDLEPGHAARPLGVSIPVSRTFVATRVQDALDIFDTPTRVALQTVLVELGRTLQGRGVDLNQAVLQLAPALEATDRISTQLAGQDAGLGRLVSASHDLASQLAPRSAAVERLIANFHRTVDLTSRHAADIDRGLAGLPDVVGRTRRTLATLGGAAQAATPLARQLAAIAPPLTRAVVSVGDFARNAGPALARTRPLLREATRTLAPSTRSLLRLGHALTATRRATPGIASYARLMTPLLPYAVKGLLIALGGIAAEPGAAKPGSGQLSDEPHRNFFRVVAVLGCESFGYRIRPGCMADAMNAAVREGRPAGSAPPKVGSANPTSAGRPGAPAAPAPKVPHLAVPAPPALPGVRVPTVPAVPPIPGVPTLPSLPKVQTVPGLRSEPAASGGQRALLDYLLGP